VARTLQRALAGRVGPTGRAIPLVAETGGQNAMIVDTSALPEQVVADVLASGFDSAGQRCSALRVLCVQEEAADRVLQMLLGAMAQLRLGDPQHLSTDVGPVIDGPAQAVIQAHVGAMRQRGRRVHQVCAPPDQPLDHGHFVQPTVIEIEALDELQRGKCGNVDPDRPDPLRVNVKTQLHRQPAAAPRQSLHRLLDRVQGTDRSAGKLGLKVLQETS
jgi:RHH-type proline utilization regulon transcriptional repressor/proline dehydrogenase/delta 1-pyrroline-5-carboxylate dehydrogenase